MKINPIRAQKARVKLKPLERPYLPPDLIKTIEGKNGVFEYDGRTQVGIKDSRGNIHIFEKSERSKGTVNCRLYNSYVSTRYAEGKRKIKVKKPFVASVVPFENNLSIDFYPFVSKV